MVIMLRDILVVFCNITRDTLKANGSFIGLFCFCFISKIIFAGSYKSGEEQIGSERRDLGLILHLLGHLDLTWIFQGIHY